MRKELDLDIAATLLQAIKKDKVKVFSKIIQNIDYLNVSYGRFPIASLCYLWGSWNILARYEKLLLVPIEEYERLEEDVQSYNKFKKSAGRSLRLYLNQERIVLPHEMLAVLGSNLRLKRYIKKHPLEDKDARRVERIYSMSRAQKATINNTNINIQRERISGRKLAIILISSFVCIVMIVLSSLFISYINATPDGSKDRPFIVNDITGFNNLIKENANLILNTDVEINGNNLAFSGAINGNGHTITIKNKDNPTFAEIKGNISNATIIIENCKIDADNNTGLLVTDNQGAIENVSLKIRNSTITIINNEETAGVPRYIGLMSARNYGDIINCSIEVEQLTLVGDAGIDGVFGSFAGLNNNLIKSNSLGLNSYLVTSTMDIGGIVGTNLGLIEDCISHAMLTQNCTVGTWSPNIGGIAFRNEGSIINCINYGDIYVNHEYEYKDGEVGNIFVGGISATNLGQALIQKCKNLGNIAISCNGSELYVGGIVASNVSENYQFGIYSVVTQSGFLGGIDVTNSKASAEYIGGIVGYNNASYITKCFSYVTTPLKSEDTIYLGGIIGIVNRYGLEKNYYVHNDSYGWISVGGQVAYGTINRISSDTEGILIPVSSFDELKQTEVYW